MKNILCEVIYKIATGYWKFQKYNYNLNLNIVHFDKIMKYTILEVVQAHSRDTNSIISWVMSTDIYNVTDV